MMNKTFEKAPLVEIIAEMRWNPQSIDRQGTSSVMLAMNSNEFDDRIEISGAEKKLHELASMDENWDGYGALRISRETTDNTRSSLNNLLRVAPVPDITPNPNGTISLEWETERGVAHLEIGKTRFSFYLKPQSGEPVFVDGLAKQIPANIGEIVSSFLFPVRNAAGTMTKIVIGFHVHTTA